MTSKQGKVSNFQSFSLGKRW